MTQKTFSATAGIIFSIIAGLHVLRLLFKWEAVIGGFPVPIWVSWVAIALFGYLACTAFKLGR